MTRYRLRILGVTVATLDVATPPEPEIPPGQRDVLSIAEQAAPYDDGRQEQWQEEDRGIGFRA